MVLSVDCFVLDPRYASNCWVIHTHENPWAVVIDPGGDPALLGADGVETAAILVTHGDVETPLGPQIGIPPRPTSPANC